MGDPFSAILGLNKLKGDGGGSGSSKKKQPSLSGGELQAGGDNNDLTLDQARRQRLRRQGSKSQGIMSDLLSDKSNKLGGS